MAVSAHAPFTDLNPAAFDLEVRGAVRKALEGFVEFGARLGASMVTLHPGTVQNPRLLEQAEPKASEVINAVVKAAGGRLSVNIENQTTGASIYSNPLGSTVESLEALLSRSPGARCTLDTGHANASGIDPFALSERLGTKLAEVHLSDNGGASDEHLAPGEGTAPLSSFMRKVAKTEALVCLELNPLVYDKVEALARYRKAKEMFG